LLNIETITTIKKDGIEYNHSDYEIEIIGNLTDEQIDFLYSIQ